MTALNVATEAALAGAYPAVHLGKREQKIVKILKTYIDASATGLAALTSAHLFVGSSLGVATDVALSGDATLANTGAMTIAALAVTSGKIAANAVTLAKLASGITPSHICVFAGSQVATLGGSATEAKTIAGLLATDVVNVTLSVKGVTPRTILTAIPSANTLTIVFSGDPSTDHKYDYQIVRAAA